MDKEVDGPRIWTIGHSTRRLDEFIALLQAHGIESLADVRSVPASGRYPHFAQSSLNEALAGNTIAYRHFPDLGGFRKPRLDSINTGWQHSSFRAYADYMRSENFESGLQGLQHMAIAAPTAVMCSEATWWRCHRRLISDALLACDWEVRHIMGSARADVHELTSFAVRDGRQLSYPEPTSRNQ